jgi:hypothetical protein
MYAPAFGLLLGLAGAGSDNLLGVLRSIICDTVYNRSKLSPLRRRGEWALNGFLLF